MYTTESKIKPLVTIVTVTYNSSKYVRDAIEGVLAQTYANIEYIIGDDCSTDNTWDIINEYKDKRIIAYRNETNLREYPNRNKAISLAKGEYLIFIDGDDYIYPTAIDYFLYYAKMHPSAALIIQKNYTNNIIFPVLLAPKQIFINNYFGNKGLLASSFTANFFRSDVLKEIGGLSNKYVSGDDDIRIRIGLQYSILFIQGWVSWPRETPNQASSKISPVIAISESIDMLNKHLNKSYVNHEIEVSMFESAKNFKLKQVCRQIIGLTLTFKILEVYKITKYLKINIFNFAKLISFPKQYYDDFDDYLPQNPYKSNLNK